IKTIPRHPRIGRCLTVNRSTPAPRSSSGPRRGTFTRRAALGVGFVAGGVAALPATGALADSGGTRNRIPAVHPQPTGMERTDRHIVLPRRVAVVVGEDTDALAGTALREVLEGVGCEVTMVTATEAESTAPGARIHLGTTQDNPTITPALELIGARGPDELPADGYV